MTSLTIDDDIRILDLEDEPAPEPTADPQPGLRPAAILRAAAGAFAALMVAFLDRKSTRLNSSH